MKYILNVGFLIVVLWAFSGCSSCTRTGQGEASSGKHEVTSSGGKEDILIGELNVVVDETVLPLIKEQEEVFLSAYPNTKLNIIAKPELLAVRELLSKTAGVAILARELNEMEYDYFKKRSITPRVFPVWTDAIVVVANTKQPDTTVTISYLVQAMKGESVDQRKIVFDNLNSSTFRHLKELGKLEKVSANFVEGQESSEKVLEAVANDPNKLGILGFNMYLDLITSFRAKDDIRILSVKNTVGDSADNIYYQPNQSTIAAEQYPLRRVFYVQNYQPNLGLGIGFSAFLTGDRGQRIVLKSGLVPADMPGRDIIIRDEIPL